MASRPAVKRAEVSGATVKRERTFGLAYVKALKRIDHLETEVDSLRKQLAKYEPPAAQSPEISEATKPADESHSEVVAVSEAAATEPEAVAVSEAAAAEPGIVADPDAEQRRAERSQRRKRRRFKKKVQRIALATSGIVVVVATVLWLMSLLFSINGFGGNSGWSSDRDSETINFDTIE